MTINEEPLFMKNSEWFTFDEETWMYKLTEKAPQEAIDSYNEYYETINSVAIE